MRVQKADSQHVHVPLVAMPPETPPLCWFLECWPGIATSLPITEGAPRLISNLKRLGYKVGILSG